MISKKYRLKEREVKKVLNKGKPFFSYTLVLNVFPHKLSYDSYAIVISGKSVPNNIVRNRYRRIFYEFCKTRQSKTFWNIVCVVKTKTKLQAGLSHEKAFIQELSYLFDKKLWKNI